MSTSQRGPDQQRTTPPRRRAAQHPGKQEYSASSETRMRASRRPAIPGVTIAGAATEYRAMKNLFAAGKLLLLDMASTFFFLILFLLTRNVTLSVLLGMTLGGAQIGWQFARKKPIDTMQWMSLFLVLGAGAATLLTNDPRFVMIKPSVIYAIVGIVMLKRGWMNRYLPPIAIELVPDIAVIFGYVWAGLMFFSAVLNLIVAMNFSVVTWSASMSIYAIVSKLALFLIQHATMRTIGVRRRRAQMAHAASWEAAASQP
jgi:intracellular septation protein A